MTKLQQNQQLPAVLKTSFTECVLRSIQDQILTANRTRTLAPGVLH